MAPSTELKGQAVTIDSFSFLSSWIVLQSLIQPPWCGSMHFKTFFFRADKKKTKWEVLMLHIFKGSSFERGERIGRKWNDGLGQNIYWLASHKIIAPLINPTTLLFAALKWWIQQKMLLINQMENWVALAREQKAEREYESKCNFKSWKPEWCCYRKGSKQEMLEITEWTKLLQTEYHYQWYNYHGLSKLCQYEIKYINLFFFEVNLLNKTSNHRLKFDMERLCFIGLIFVSNVTIFE